MSKEVLFIQFYYGKYDGGSGSKILIDNKYVSLKKKSINEEYFLCNGFSSMYTKCKEIGDFYWINYNLDGDFDEILKKNKEIELPINSGKVYISAYYNVHLYQAYLWSIKYPNIDFIVGGPAVDRKKILEELPKNLFLIYEPLNTFLNGKESWGIEIPPQMNKKRILFGFPVERTCYWGKCTFCSYAPKREVGFEKFDCNFADTISSKNYNRIFLTSPSLSPEFLLNKLPLLVSKPHIEYWASLRADKHIVPIIEQVLKNCVNKGFALNRFSPLTGIEFPSSRMMDIMNKGMTIEQILNYIDIVYRYKCKIALSFIVGWNNLTEEDIEEASRFFKKLFSITQGKLIIKTHYLACKINTPLFDTNTNLAQVKLGPFLLGATPSLSRKQLELNKQYKREILSSGFLYLWDQSDNLTYEFL